MLTSSVPVKSMAAVTVETKPGMTEQEKSDLERELETIKERLQKTERELSEEKKLTQSQVLIHLVYNKLSALSLPESVMETCSVKLELFSLLLKSII